MRQATQVDGRASGKDEIDLISQQDHLPKKVGLAED